MLIAPMTSESTQDAARALGSSLQRAVRHGRGAYVIGCRCDTCVDANREYQRRYSRERFKNGMADSHGKTKVPNQHITEMFRKRATKWEFDEGELGKIVAAEIRTVVDTFESILSAPNGPSSPTAADGDGGAERKA